MEGSATERVAMNRTISLLMALGCAVSVANLYYCQPLLAEMGRNLGAGSAAGYVPAFTLAGMIIGMFLFVPLGDVVDPRRLIVIMCGWTACAAIAMALAPTLTWLIVASVALGTGSIVHHLILPFAARTSPTDQRGKVVGILLCGILFGILLARTASGFIAVALGWRMVYWMAAGLMLSLGAGAWMAFPGRRPAPRTISYRELLGSLLTLTREQPLLRESSIIGAMIFGALNAFWVNLIFLLESPPYHYGARAAGLFGLAGAAGAACAPFIGRIADRRGARFGLKPGADSGPGRLC
jgi:MFS family permease